MLFFTILACILQVIRIEAAQKLQNHFEWKILDWVFPTPQDRLNAMLTGRYKPENALPVGIEIWQDKMFITVPRWKEGIPATLNYVDLNSPVKDPPLIPYPDLDSNELGNCNSGLSTVYRIHADACDRLWVLDTGTFGIDKTTQNPCPYALNIFDLRTHRKIRRYEFRKEDTNARTFIANTLVDMGDTCEDAHAYFSDELGYGLIVYSYKENKSWRFEHSYFMPDPLKGDFNINGLNFQWGEEGIFGMSLSPIRKNGFKTLYFSPLASNREFAVSTQILKNESKVEDAYHDFYYLDERGPNTHTTSRVMNKDGVQFFNLIDQNAVGCWNYKTTYGAQNVAVVDKDDKGLIFPCDVKVDKKNYLWVISDRMSDFLIAQLDFNDINFNIFFAPVDSLIKGTVCEVQPALENQFGYYQTPQSYSQGFGQLQNEKYPQSQGLNYPQATGFDQKSKWNIPRPIELGYNLKTFNSLPQITSAIQGNKPRTYKVIDDNKNIDFYKQIPTIQKYPNLQGYFKQRIDYPAQYY